MSSSPLPPLLEFENVTVCQGERVALDRLTLCIAAGEHVAILGPNGSGKSTFIKTINRELYPRFAPPACDLRLFGQDRWNVFDLRPLLGIVTNDLVEQCEQPYPAEDIILSGFFSSIGIWPNHEVTPDMRARAADLMSLLEITHLSGRSMLEMSSGERRRVVIARALVHQPKALLLDEPSNSLDIRAFQELRSAMRTLAQAGIGIILVTHHLPDIIPEIDRVICLREGRVFLDGPKREVLTAATLRSLFGLDVQFDERDGYYLMW